jgi:type VI secretion system secreted protein VgrG
MSEYSQQGRRLRLEVPALGQTMDDDASAVLFLTRVEGRESISDLFEYRLELISTSADVDPDTLLGQALAFCIIRANEAGEPRWFHGHVRSFEYVGTNDRISNYRAVVVPWLWFATQMSDSRIWQDKKAHEVLSAVLGEVPFNAVADADVEKGNQLQRVNCTQYRETHYDFVRRLLEEEGVGFYFDHTQQQHAMVMFDAVSKCLPCVEQEVELSDDNTEESGLKSWRRIRRFTAGGVASTDYNDQTPAENLLVSTRTVLALSGQDDLELLHYPGGHTTAAAGEALVKRLIERHEGSHESVTGESNCVTWNVGGRFKITHHPNPDEVGKEYVITRLSFVVEAGGFTTGGEVSLSYQNEFECVPAESSWKPPVLARKPRIEGVQTAIVVGGQNQETHVDAFGRIRLQFFWDRHGGKRADASCWVRVAQPWAGDGYGTWFLPRVGNEVVVSFLEGDPDRPLVIGSVYHKDHKQPYSPSDDPSVSTIKTLTTPDGNGYNELRFQDKKGDEQVFIHSQRRMDVRVKASLLESVGGNREETVGADDKGDLNRTICNDLNLHNKGGRFEKVEKKRHEEVTEDVVEVYGKTHTSMVKERLTLNAQEIVAEAKQTLSQKANEVVIQGAMGASVKAGSVKIEGTQTVSIKCGGSFLVLTPSGVFLSGPTVFINSGGASQPAGQPLQAQDPTIETPIDALAASTQVPGRKTTGGGGGSPRTRTARVVQIQRAPDPPPPPPTGPVIPPIVGPVNPDRKFLSIAWVQKTAYCGDNATLMGSTSNYNNGETEPSEVRKVIDGEVVKTPVLNIDNNAYAKDVPVVDVLPDNPGGNYEEFKDLDGFAAGKKTSQPLKVKFIPNLAKKHCNQGLFTVKTHFDLQVVNYQARISSSIKYIKGWAREIIDLHNTVPAGTGGLIGVNAYGKNNWRWAQISATGTRQYWNGSAWVDVPATWADNGGLDLYGMYVYKNGTNYPTQMGTNFPQAPPDWNVDAAGPQNTLRNWASHISTRWTGVFDIKRDGCTSTDQHCCRYKIKASVAFTKVAAKDNDTVVIAQGTTRANAALWTLGGNIEMPVHEWGHHLGNPDEYAGQQVATYQDAANGLVNGLDTTSVMGQSMNTVKARHYGAVLAQLARMVKDEHGKDYTYTCVPVI